MAHLWPGASLGLKELSLEAMHSDMDIVTGVLGPPRRVDITTIARGDDSASIKAAQSFDRALVHESVSSFHLALAVRLGLRR